MKSLIELVKRHAKFSGRQLLSYDTLAEFPKEQAKELEVKGVLFQIKDADGIICTECDQECWKPVETRIKDGKAIGVIYCTDDDSGGLVEVELVRLQQWEIVKEKLFKLEKPIGSASVLPPVDTIALGLNEDDIVTLPPIDTEGLWNRKDGSLSKLRKIDSNNKREGISGDKVLLKRLKEYLKREGVK